MKRGVLRSYLDSNRGQLQYNQRKDLLNKKLRPSRIEERIRMRKLHMNNIHGMKSPDSVIGPSNVTGGNNSNSHDSSSPKTNSIKSANSCSSSSSENFYSFPKIRDSKQRVDLLELQASNRAPVNLQIRSKKSKSRLKINGEKLGSVFIGRSKIKARAKSAPCTPLFRIKYAKNNCNGNFEAANNFVDCKIVEKDCIAFAPDEQTRITDEIINDRPIGNPALISVMTESLDKMREKLKSSKSQEEINNEKCDDTQGQKSERFNSDSNSDPTEICGNRINGIEPNVAPQEPEIQSKSSGSLGNRSNEHSPGFSADRKDEGLIFESRNDRASVKSPKNSIACSCETSVEKKRVDFSPRNFTSVETYRCDVPREQKHDSNFTNDERNESDDLEKIQIFNADLNNCGTPTCRSNSSRNDSRAPSVLKKCKNRKNCCSEKSGIFLSNADSSSGSPDVLQCSENRVEGNFLPKSRGCFSNSTHQRVCNRRADPARFNCRSNFETDCEAEEDRCAVASIAEREHGLWLKIQSGKTIGKYLSSTNDKPSCAAIRSCNYCNREVAKCCRKVDGWRSKSSPRKVTFCLPSSIPEEGESWGGREDGKTERSYSRVCRCGCPGVRELDRNLGELEKSEFLNSVLRGTKKFARISGCNFHFHNCACNFHHKSRSPRVHFCREIISKHQDIVRGDFHCCKEVVNKEELAGDFESKTSVTSAKEWAVDSVEDDFIAFQNISFPKETRQAINVLLQSKVEKGGTQSHRGENSHVLIPGQEPRQNQKLPLREVKVLKKPDLGIFDTAGHKAMKSTGSIPAETGSEFSLEKIVKRANRKHKRRRNQCPSFLRNNKFDPNPNNSKRSLNVPAAERPTGLTMQTNGSDNGSSENGVDRTGWTVGLINGRFKYLTAETFGFKINANGASLKKKQLWTLEGSEHQVFLRSHLDRYLAVDQFGNVTCEAEDTADPGCAFQIQVASDGSGRWALKNIQRGYFLGSSQDELKCTAKVPGDAEYWLVHLAARPQVNLRSAGRKRFAHLSAAQDEIHVDAPVPWGEDTLFTLEFRPAAMPDNVDGNADARREVRSEAGIGGHYALHTCNNKYLARDGKLLDSCTRDCLYAAEFHAGMLALRDVSGAYLAPIGSKAVLKSRSNTVTRDELFSLEDSLPQASFVAALNQRYVSVKQGVDVTANQDEISGHETFQLEFDRATKRWYLRTMQDRYWTLEAGGGIQASDHKRSSNALFDLVWQPADGTVALRANNGKFLATKRSGHLYANADSPGDSEASKFYFYLMNRPVLVLRCEQGFVGLKSNASPKLECNKASYETIRVERCDRGIVRFKGQNGKYWHADSEGVTSDADVPSDGFYLELREPSRLCIKSTDGRYLSAGKNGVFRLGDTDYESATKWEF